MRVGFNAQLVQRPAFGVSQCVSGLLEALAQDVGEHELVVYLPPGVLDEFVASAERPGLRCVRSPVVTRSRAWRILWEQGALARRCRHDGLDLLHAPGYVMPANARLPVVATVYDLLALTDPAYCKRANRLHYGLMLPLTLRRARHVIVPAEAVRRQVLEGFGRDEDSVTVIPPGIAPGFHSGVPAEELERVRDALGLPSRFVLFVGNHEPKKNLGRLVAAMHIARRDPSFDAELVLTGGGGWGDVLADARDTAFVHRLDYVPQRWMPHVYRLARVFAFPSLAEGFGLPVIEAMACETPVVCSRVPAVAESDRRAVHEVDARSVESIADGLLTAWTDSAGNRARVEAGRQAARRFTWEAAAARTWQLYARVLGAQR